MRLVVVVISLSFVAACGAGASRSAHARAEPAQGIVPARTFWMGSPEDEPGRDPDEGPRAPMTIASFRADVTPVTVADFEARLDEVRARAPQATILFEHETPAEWPGRCNLGSPRRDHPVNCVSHDAARAYCALRGADLPTEAEREAMARGSTESAYFWGDSYDAAHTVASVVCGTRGCAGGTAPVVREGPRCNALGLCDVAGNVWEWTITAYRPELGPHVLEVPPLDAVVESPVIRGAAWVDEEARRFRSAFRGLAYPENGLTHIGFRCVSRVGMPG